jgi:luciferase family oxidoreductase group 1
MLPNHAPLVIAEQFGTLESLYPGRIDLGLGRAPGTDATTTRALRRDPYAAAESFPSDVAELRGYFAPTRPGQAVRAVPGAGLNVPIWLLGSSMYSAQLAAHLGLPFAFASHFAPDYLLEALDAYRRGFMAADGHEKPYAMATTNVIAADTDEEARRLFKSLQQQFINVAAALPAGCNLQTRWTNRRGRMRSDSRSVASSSTRWSAAPLPCARASSSSWS